MFKISFYSHGVDTIKTIGAACGNTFCIVGKCDENLLKIKQIAKNMKIAPKSDIFTDGMSEEEIARKKENRMMYMQKFGKKRDAKMNGKRGFYGGESNIGFNR